MIIEARIEGDGHVSDARVLRSIPLLDAAALDAVKQWQYTPTLLNGVPVPVIMTVTVNFTLHPIERFDAGTPVEAYSGAPKYFQNDSTRTPFRVGQDYCYFGEPRANYSTIAQAEEDFRAPRRVEVTVCRLPW